jgi:cytochrome c oxidase subunit 2
MNRTLGVTLIAALFIPMAVMAGEYTPVPAEFIYCTTCHGVEFRGNASVDAPRLNGMEDWYLTSQMKAFKNGQRGTHSEDLIGMEMQPQAAALDEAGIDRAVAFVASVPVRTGTIEQTVTGDTQRGESLYATCAACHGPAGQGSKVLNAPRLAGQSDWYLVRQLENYAAGARGYAPADTAGQQMRAATAVLPDRAAIQDVVAFINTLSPH